MLSNVGFMLVLFLVWLNPGSDVLPDEIVGCVGDRFFLGAAGTVEVENRDVSADAVVREHRPQDRLSGFAIRDRARGILWHQLRSADGVARLESHVFVFRPRDLADHESACVRVFGVEHLFFLVQIFHSVSFSLFYFAGG